MKKLVVLILAMIMVLSIVGCTPSPAASGTTSGTTSEQPSSAQPAGKPLIGFCVQSMISLHDLTGQALEAKFPDADVQVVSADNNVSTQIQQIQSFTTMKAKMIIVAPTEIAAITDALIAAREAGVKVLISGATAAINEEAYDAVTGSDEYLIGCYVAMLAKKWAEETLANQQFDTVMLSFTANADAVDRSNGEKSIREQYLKDRDGNYVDQNGQKVDEANKVANPAYSEMVKNAGGFYEYEVGPTGDALATSKTALLEHPNAKLILCYMSLNAKAMSQHIIDTIPEANWNSYGIFGGGLLGDEKDYLIGSVSATAGTRSVFRGAVSFGGDDVAAGIADLAYNVLNGKAGVDYQKSTPSSIGVYFTRKAEFTFPAKVCSFSVANQPTPVDFDIMGKLTDPTTTVQWKEGDATAPGASALPAISMGAAVDASAIVGKPFSFLEEVPQFNLKVNFTLELKADGSYSITEDNPNMGKTVYTGAVFTFDGTYILTGPITSGNKPIAGWFESDGSCYWKLEGETLKPVKY